MTVRERWSPDNEMRSGGRGDETPWSERAAFRIAIESRDAGEGRLAWRTRAYHEEHDQHKVWTGVPDEALIEWLHEQLRQSIGSAVPSPIRRLPESIAPTVPDSAVPPDDLQQIPGIGPAIARRLHAAGITTFAALAACSPSDLAAWTGRSTEQITRMSWIERAHELAHPPSLTTPALEPAAELSVTMEAPPPPAEAEPLTTAVPPHTTEAEPLTTAVPPHTTEAEPLTTAAPPQTAEAELLTTEAPPAAAEPLTTEAPPAAAEAKPVEEKPIAEFAEPLGETVLPIAAEATREAQEMMLEESPIMFAAILLDEEGDVRGVCLTMTDEQPPEWNDQQVARFFIETGTPLPAEAVFASLHLNDVQIETVPAQRGKGGASQLHATATVHLEGAATTGKQSMSCHVVLLAYDLASGETHILNTTRIECAPDTLDIPLTLDADLPEVGRYQLLLAALMPEARALSAISGPRLRVTP